MFLDWERRDTVSDGDALNHERIALAFVVLQLIGAFGHLAVLLIALFGPGVKRMSTWYSFGISWILSCISYSLLAIAGQRQTPQPNFSLCLVQGALIYAAPALTGCTTLALITHVSTLLYTLAKGKPFKTNLILFTVMLVLPYVVWVSIFLVIILYGIENPHTVQRSPNGAYCNSTSNVWARISSLIMTLCMVLITVAVGVICRRLYKGRHSIPRSGQYFALVARVIIFSLIGVLALVVSISFVMTSKHGQIFDLILACLPVLAVLVFGSQMDIFKALTCRGVRLPPEPEEKASLTQYSSISTEEALLRTEQQAPRSDLRPLYLNTLSPQR